MELFLKAEHARRPALLLTGSRQVGKTSLLEHVFPEHAFVSLDLPRHADEAESSGEAFLAKHAPPLIIDEVQYAPVLFRYLKHDIDAHRGQNGRFLLTGSEKLALMESAAESLAGRVAVVELHSLSLREIERFRGKPIARGDLDAVMWAGGYPELVAEDLDPRRFYADYVATYLERDVRRLLGVRNLRDFDRFLRQCAFRNGQLLSMNALASDVGVSPNTIRSWLSVLEASNVVVLLPPYFRNLGKRLVKTPKLYFLDTGLACFLAGIDSVAALAGSALHGAMFESLVLGQIVRHFANRGEATPVYFYRDHHGHEIDFVLAVGEKLRLIEVKWAERPDPETRGMREVESLVGAANVLDRVVITPTRGRTSLGRTSIEDAVDLGFLSPGHPRSKASSAF